MNEQRKIPVSKMIKAALFPKAIVIAILIVGSISIIGNMLTYVINRDVFVDAAAESENYKDSMTFNPEQGIVRKDEEDGQSSAKDIGDYFDEEHDIWEYLKDDEDSTKEQKLEYLMNAELVTKYPYVAALENDESKLNGVIRFYRYTNQLEAEEGEEILEDEPEESEENPFNPKEIFYIGDSWMNGLSSYIKSYKKAEYPGDNHFLCGDGLDALDDKFSNENLRNAIGQVADEVSSIVIMLGLNDTSEGAATRMNQIIDFLSTTYPGKTVYVLKVPHVGANYYLEAYNVDASSLNIKIDKYNPIILENCSDKENVKFIDVTNDMMTDDLFLKTKYIKDDGLHLNTDGNAFWYSNIKECIEQGKSAADLEKFQMTYISYEEFERMAKASRNSGNKDIFKYFTINEENEMVIAVWRETSRTVRTNDPEITVDTLNENSTYTFSETEDGAFVAGKYTISTAAVMEMDSLTQNYSMPFNLLLAFLVQTKDYRLTAEIAEMAYQSKICVGIYDNQVVSVQNNSETYNKRIRYTENTILNLPDTVLSNPTILINDEGVVQYCKGLIHNDQRVHYGNVEYDGEYHSAEGIDIGEDEKIRNHGGLYYLYVKQMSNDKIITDLAIQSTDAQDFKTSTHVTTINCTTPSIGVTLVDNWLARWEATYKMESEDSTSNGGSGNSGDDEYQSIQTSQLSSGLITGNSLIGSKLEAHSKSVKEEARTKLMSTINFSVPQRTLTKNIIKEHLDSCFDNVEGVTCCQDRIEIAFGVKYDDITEEDMQNVLQQILEVNENANGNEELYAKARIKRHINEAERARNQRIREERRNRCYEELDPTNIPSTDWATVEKADVDVSYESSSSKTPYSYEKDKTTMENEGIKFKEIINKEIYLESKRGLLNRSDWFWECIRSKKDTAQIEDAIRVMLNIAFETDQFGSYSEKELERIFKGFEPKMRKKSGGGHFNAFAQWLMTFENGWLRSYVNGGSTSYETVANYVTEDGQFGKMYFTEADGCWNFSYGIMVCNKDGNLNNTGIFAEYGYDLEDLVNRAKAGETVTVPMEDLDQIYVELIRRKYNHVKSALASHDVKLEIWQYFALVNFVYQWGNCGELIEGEDNIAEVYKKYYVEEQNPEKFRENAQCQTSGGGRAHFWIEKYTIRQDAAWILFHEGRYILGTGEEIFPSGSGDYPEGIKVIEVGDYMFPQYPQTPGGGPQYVLYENVPFGGPNSKGVKTLRTSACGVFSASCIISGLLSDSSIDPITYTENLDEYFPNGDYYVYDQGGTSAIWNNGFLKKYYGFSAGYSGCSISKMKEVFEEKMGCCGAIMGEDGHYIAALPIIDGFGKCETFQIIDSTGQHTGIFESEQDYVEKHPDAIYLRVCAILY